MKKPVILFDCDGTLVDSEILAMGVAIDILADAVREQKPDAAIDRDTLIQKFAGWHFDKMIPEMGNQYGLILDAQPLIKKKTPETLRALEQVSPCIGIFSCLADLQNSGYQTALVTSSEFTRVNLCLERTGLDAFFPEDRKFSAHDTLPHPCHKPDPAIYNFALRHLGIGSKSAIAIEDSKSGVTSASRASVPVIGYVGASHIPMQQKPASAETLLAHGASIVITHMDDLPAAIEMISGISTRPTFKSQTYFSRADNSLTMAQPYPSPEPKL